MKILLFILTFSFLSASFAASTYKCESFTNKEGLTYFAPVASVFEDENGELSLVIGKKMEIATVYKMKNTNKGPVFNVYTYNAGPHKVLYYQDKNLFVVKIDDKQATCKEVRR